MTGRPPLRTPCAAMSLNTALCNGSLKKLSRAQIVRLLAKGELMPLFNLFSKRKREALGQVPDVFVFDSFPTQLRVTLVHIFRASVRNQSGRLATQVYALVRSVLCREYGRFYLSAPHNVEGDDLIEFFVNGASVDEAFDITELWLRCVDMIVRPWLKEQVHDSVDETPDTVIAEVNARFREHGIGYEYDSGQLIRVDSTFLHAEVVKPALVLLANKSFEGADQEFRSAHDHYRHGRYKECLVDCLKVFESVLKVICTNKQWSYNNTDTARRLLEVCERNGLFAPFMQSHVGALRALLEAGVPTIRNKLGGHGQGTEMTAVNEATARFVLHSTATQVLFFIESAA